MKVLSIIVRLNVQSKQQHQTQHMHLKENVDEFLFVIFSHFMSYFFRIDG